VEINLVWGCLSLVLDSLQKLHSEPQMLPQKMSAECCLQYHLPQIRRQLLPRDIIRNRLVRYIELIDLSYRGGQDSHSTAFKIGQNVWLESNNITHGRPSKNSQTGALIHMKSWRKSEWHPISKVPGLDFKYPPPTSQKHINGNVAPTTNH
jgi:hypothetical protein